MVQVMGLPHTAGVFRLGGPGVCGTLSVRYMKGWMSIKPFTRIASVVFALVCLAHVTRLSFGWDVAIHGVFIPAWVSVVGMVATAVLSVMLWRESIRTP